MSVRSRIERLEAAYSKRLASAFKAPITDDERRRRWFAANPNGADGALDELAARVGRLQEAADAGDEGAAAQLERVMAGWVALLERRES